MSKCTEIREICGDYAFDVEYSEDNKFTMFFGSLRNAQTVKRCIEVDDSVPNVATAVDFVEVVRCKDCEYCYRSIDPKTKVSIQVCGYVGYNPVQSSQVTDNDFCSHGERKEQK